ncbi:MULTISPECIES: ABC transporter ATP-binding protein [unclassified Ruegeria]|uniref:ABC transporter ATP-binding protein n=1 Tax=unclassified Ruegeria TaxID=2625375 RepID=UPI0014876F55|nr:MULTISPECIES: ABC transporter ATP-binding protein [unclassified Ruegeria]NOD76806.1 ATP-binding cassette domain-containing protein [Ruegeria sp. HKCCD4332]NOD88316.1 ATP-binding cassette domain-containing protein [Ruegeria sp. HKCCD4318]NOE13225.1 ATP-binding cassette domain-containing protein [Ruegeria sp. HKCCD4318-2]NOG11233.1 ABC transporter ATP-binding protein [Ruegeria sp. HKCCD4315]
MSFLSVEGLEYYALNGDVLLQDVSFGLEEGSILAIAGPNGAGKTTLLKLLCGIERIALGDVLIRGKSLRTLSAHERARTIAVVGQQEMPDGRLRLRDYVALGQIPIQADKSATEHKVDLDRVLETTGLSHLSRKPMSQLSGGERQRAHIARALAQNPSLLFLDEPTNHLDPDAKGHMLSLVAELGVTVVMIVHDLVMIPEFATHVALMKSTRLTGYGPVSDVLTSERVRDTFGVDYLCFQHEGRIIPALDIRKRKLSS